MVFTKSLPCRGDDAVVLFAAAQFGLVSREQARRAGLSFADISARLRRGAWARTLHRGVFRVLDYGTLASPLKQAVVAAQLALPTGAFACRATAARLWRLDGLAPWDGHTVDMAVPGRRTSAPPPPSTPSRAVPPAVRIHALRVCDSDIAVRAPIRLTGVGRTLRDMAACSPARTRTRLRGSAVGRGLVVSGRPDGRSRCRGRPPPVSSP
ncbi:type IV toxin-antitoxin system AbiEi family antitoxin domain-containing protein [Streptomonospora salina]|uniref:AbiEi antitoxin N-terminal domain-containing protein n=1 Tax=Streptomonospora salina TaxID=104205 RepID=A0A841EEF7_9ACTN|nr:type IV toxin-antitoxin system AbiEi family antitoxin domain-containing protein [Streptomonospora salina]MBB5999433.1 hypothetical protein [Streptomonospora salina]